MNRIKTSSGCIPARWILAFISFLGFTATNLIRVTMNLTIVTMVKPQNTTNLQSQVNECSFESQETSSHAYEGPFEWSEKIQGLITGSFFWGYLLGQILAGRLADTIGAKIVLGVGITASAFLSAIIPFVAYYHYLAVILVRFFMGLSLSPSLPAMLTLISSWSPPSERSSFTAFINSGMQVGTVIGYPMAAAIVNSLGWQWVFYIQSSITLLWSVIWFICIADTPEEFKWISESEVLYIKESIGKSKNQSKQSHKVPWLSILSSLPFWACVIAALGNNWGYYTLQINLPIYLNKIMQFNIKTNALLTSMPYVGQWFVGILIGIIVDTVIKKNKFSTTTVRKLSQCFSQFCPAICLICLQAAKCNREVTVLILFLAVSLNGGYQSGYSVNAIELAPNFVGTVYGILNTFANSTGFFAPVVAGIITDGQQTSDRWMIIFYLSSAIYVAGAIFYVLFGSAKEQPWNKVSDNSEKRKDEIEDNKKCIEQ